MQYTNPYGHLSGKLTDTKMIQAGFIEKNYIKDDISMNYVVGPMNGPALLLIPAQMGTWESYKKVMIPLSKIFQVYVVDIRGHGKSSWTPGNYSWKVIGDDLTGFITNVVGGKVIVGGNSSGGILALWCAANLQDYVSGVIIEDAPIFSVEMPRFKEEDKFVYNGLKHLVDKIGDIEHRNIADYFSGMEMPVSDKRVKKIPEWFVVYLTKKIKKFESNYPGVPIAVGFPDTLKLLIKSLSMFDPDFARAFVDGRFYEGINHEKALRAIKCPVLLLHANWKRLEKYGLVGAMDDNDARRVQELVTQTTYRKIAANHVIHAFKPKQYIDAILDFALVNKFL